MIPILLAPFAMLRRRSPLTASVSTAVAFTAALWLLRTHETWPFDHVAPASTSASMPSIDVSTTPETHDRVLVDVTAADALDIRLETVGRETLTETIKTVATIAPDESRISHVHTRVAGWVEQLDVNTTGELVHAGQPLARIFSQELLSSQTEYLSARENVAASGIASVVIASGRTRLGVLGMSAAEIDEIEQSGQAKRLVTVVAPRRGVVISRGVTVGTSVDPSTPLLTVADLARVWVLAEVPEPNIPSVRVGTVAQLEFPASGRPPLAARVDFIYPTLTERTRTLRVRLSVANPGGVLRPGLYGTAAFESEGRRVLMVSRDAVIDTGAKQHVFVLAGNQFRPQPVVVGTQLADRVEIREGLHEGEQIVAAGVFLLDSESRLRATGGSGHAHGSASDAGATPVSDSSDPHAGHSPPNRIAPRGADPRPKPTAEPPVDPHAGHRE